MRTISSVSFRVLLPILAACSVTDPAGESDDATASGSSGAESTAGADTGSTGDPAMPTLPDVSQATFVDVIDNPYLPMPVGATWVIEATTDEGTERIEIEVLAETRDIQGVTATVVRDTAYLDGAIIEDTWDWFAQDSLGNVWYLGEDTCEFEDGMCVSMVGAWEWGQAGALPGIVMPANPTVDGQPYYQEYDVGEAEDVGEVIEVGASVSVPAGEFTDCIKTHDTSTLDPDLQEFKYYCRGVGLTLIEEADVREQLVEYEV